MKAVLVLILASISLPAFAVPQLKGATVTFAQDISVSGEKDNDGYYAFRKDLGGDCQLYIGSREQGATIKKGTQAVIDLVNRHGKNGIVTGDDRALTRVTGFATSEYIRTAFGFETYPATAWDEVKKEHLVTNTRPVISVKAWCTASVWGYLTMPSHAKLVEMASPYVIYQEQY